MRLCHYIVSIGFVLATVMPIPFLLLAGILHTGTLLSPWEKGLVIRLLTCVSEPG